MARMAWCSCSVRSLAKSIPRLRRGRREEDKAVSDKAAGVAVVAVYNWNPVTNSYYYIS